MVQNTNKILLTGATGYVGGTLLNTLLKCEDPIIKGLTFDLPVRRGDQAEKLRGAYGSRVNPFTWKGLDDTASVADLAANYDIILNAGSNFFPAAGLAFVEGLARRIKPDAPKPWLVHISGCTNLADRPLTGTAYPDRVWEDADAGPVYEYLKSEDAKHPYPQRTAEVGVLTAGQETGVQVVSLNTPLIFGEGTGLYNRQGIIIPILMRYTVKHGYGFTLSDEANFDWVHVEDLADAFLLMLKTILERQDHGVGYIPTGSKGLMFPAVGRVKQTEIMQGCLDAAFDAGVLPRDDTPKEKEIREVSLQHIADEITFGLLDMAEQGWAGNKAMSGTMLRKLVGWKPSRLEDAWKQDFVDELNALREGRRGGTMESAIGIK
ncbi:hypothetical protein F4779DRAFT_239776 [Xylariaceae sp. FL0662B]|nr:hypothetical protein F4779DRAFT_239776 [Xylariaceae sp. FL0662B]